MMSLQDIANARLVCNFWKFSANACLRNPHTINHDTQQQLCIDANQFGPIDRGTALDPQRYGSHTCTTQSVKDHLICDTCNSFRHREIKVRPPTHWLAGPREANLLATLGANLHGGTRSRLPGTKSHTRPRYWLDMSQLAINPCLLRMLDAPVHCRQGRWDFTITEQANGMFSFTVARAQVLKELGSVAWDEAFYQSTALSEHQVVYDGKTPGPHRDWNV